MLPRVLAASDRKAAVQAMHTWIMALGPVADCTTCTSLSQTELHLTPEVDWLGDEEMLGAELSQDLKHIYRNRASTKSQFYISQVTGVQNPVFDQELAYQFLRNSDPGFQLLAFFIDSGQGLGLFSVSGWLGVSV